MRWAADDWSGIVEALREGDRAALARVSGVITGFLERLGAYEHRDSWDDLSREVLVTLLADAPSGRITDARHLVNQVGAITRDGFDRWLSKRGHAAVDPPGTDRGGHAGRDFVNEARLRLARALSRLPELEGDVVRQVYLAGRSHEEAAQAVGVSVDTLRDRLAQVLTGLRDELTSPAARDSTPPARPDAEPRDPA